MRSGGTGASSLEGEGTGSGKPFFSNLDFDGTSPSVTVLATRFLSNMLRAKQNSLRLVGPGLSLCYCEMGQSCHLRCALDCARTHACTQPSNHLGSLEWEL